MGKLDIQRLRNYAREAIFARGERLESGGAVDSLWISRTDMYGEEEIHISGYVGGERGKFYHVDGYLYQSDGAFSAAGCNCSSFGVDGGICEHCVALFIHYLKDEWNYLSKIYIRPPKWAEDARRTTTPGLAEVLRQFSDRERLMLSANTVTGKVRLESMLLLDTKSISVSLRIGIDKMYVVKDILRLVQRVNSVENYSYGKNLTFVHSIDAFDDKSRPVMEFFLRQFEDYSRWYSSGPRYYELNYGQLDEYLDMVGKNGIIIEKRSGAPQEYVMTDEPLCQKIVLKGEPEGVFLECSLPYRIHGKTYNYYLKDGVIYRQDRRERSEIDGLEEFLYTGGSDVFIGKDDLPLFVREVLPAVEKYYDVSLKGGDLQEYMPDDAQFKAYFDLPQENMITCDLVSEYADGNKFHVFEGIPKKGNRNVVQEMKAHAAVMKYCNAFDDVRHLAVAADEECMYTLLNEGLKEIQEVAELYISDRLKKMAKPNRTKITIGVSLSGDLLDLKISADGMSLEELASVLSKYDRKKKFVRLKDGSFLSMEDDGLDTLAQVQKGLMLKEKDLAKGEIAVPKFRALFLDAQLRENEGLPVSKSRDFKTLVRNMHTVEDSDYEVPKSLSGILREYQKTGYRWLETLCENGFGGILADDMGLGKTLQVIAFLLARYQADETGIKRTLVVCPASLVYNWEDECMRFAPALPVQVIAGTAAERAEMLRALPERVVVLTSYDLLKRDVKEYQKIHFDYQIIDEAQFIKNANTKAAQAVKAVPSGFRAALTGTPVENRLSELWSIFDYLMPGYLYTYTKFNRELESPIVKNNDGEALSRLQKMISPFVLRRLKKDVLKDLPDKLERNMVARMEGEQKELYDAHVQRLQIFLDRQSNEEFDRAKIQVLAELTKLRQLCCEPSLLYEGYKGGSAKLGLCMELVENAIEGGHKILIFSQFTSMLDIIADSLGKNGINFYMLTGATPKQERLRMVNAFNRDEVPVFCISLKAGGTGLNLTAADIVIHYDPWWNTAAQDQATDRTHRIGQKNVVMVYRLIAKDTIEENIVRLQERKAELADQVLGGEEAGRASFSREELMELLSGH